MGEIDLYFTLEQNIKKSIDQLKANPPKLRKAILKYCIRGETSLIRRISKDYSESDLPSQTITRIKNYSEIQLGEEASEKIFKKQYQ